jgi:hypothetical protein
LHNTRGIIADRRQNFDFLQQRPVTGWDIGWSFGVHVSFVLGLALLAFARLSMRNTSEQQLQKATESGQELYCFFPESRL